MERIVPLNDAAFAAQTISYTGSAVALATDYPTGPQAVHVVATTDCYVRVGEGVTATAGDLFVSAGVPYVLGIPNATRGKWTVSAIRVATSGTLYVKPLQG